MKKSDKVLLLSLIAVVAVVLIIWYYWDKVDEENNGQGGQQAVVNDFNGCVAAGYAVAESYPRQCSTPDGRTFVEDIGNELEKIDLIRISSPRPNDTIQSPIRITGEARGLWFFEASFPAKIYDANGKELGTAIVTATEDWMTEEFVPFEAMMEFKAPTTATGTLVLQKDNPSGLPENDDKLVVPVKFGTGEGMQQVSLYYYNASKDTDPAKGGVQCSEAGLAEVKRNIKSGDSLIEDTIKLLLAGGITAEEKAAGISTEFPLPDFKLESSSLDKNGVLTLTFQDPQSKASGGSCRVGVLRMEIEATAKQFPEVKSVRIMPEDIMQP
jgi:hypothetical protein